MRALVTGGFGFVGRHLAKYLVTCGDDVAVTYHPTERGTADESFKTALPAQAQTVSLDVTDGKAVEQLLAVMKPDAIYHLAGLSFVPAGESDPQSVFQANAFGTMNMLQSLVKTSPKTRFLYVSSAEVYGDPRPGSLPLTENSVLRPVSNYGISKVVADLATFKFSHREGLDTVRVRPFPHIGPGQSETFAISGFAKQLAEIKLGKREAVIKVGNLEPKRDFTDVSDIVRGYRETCLNGKRGEVYNLCSGSSIAIGDVLQLLIKIAEVEVEIEPDPERMRAVDITNLLGSAEKALKDFGWKPRVDLEGTLSSIFAFWIEALAKA